MKTLKRYLRVAACVAVVGSASGCVSLSLF